MATRRSRNNDPSGDITFVVPGQAQAAGATRGADARGTIKASALVGTQRDAGGAVRLTARPDEDMVELTIAGGPTLVLHPAHAAELLRAQAAAATRGAPVGADANEVAVNAQLGWPGLEPGGTRGATRGWVGQAVLKAIAIVTGVAKDPAATLAAAAITAKVDGAVDEGVYALQPDALPAALKGHVAKLANVPAAADGQPLLVLVHGTFVDTVSTFGKLWARHPDVVRQLFAQYAGRVYAFDHPTLGKSPIANALALVQALPAGARLHPLTHSRGGLVAEVLARACGAAGAIADELAPFAGDAYKQHRADLQALITLARSKGLKIERVVRVACPARGTLLASKRLDAYLSVLKWCMDLAGVPVLPDLVDFLHEVALRRADPTQLPGLEAMMPESPVVAWLNGADETIPGELRVIAGDMQGDSVMSWVKTLLTDAYYWTDNDIVVQTRSMYGGTPRGAGSAAAPPASFLLDRGGNVSHFNYFANDRTVQAMLAALTSDPPADFAAIGPLSWAGQDAGGSRGALAVARSRGGPGADPASRPAVFVLPGILGSNLKLDGRRIWLGFRFVNGLMRLAWDPATASRVEPDGPIGLTYDDLIDRLADTHEVIPFAYDWRRPIEDEARRLADAVDAALAARDASRQPVRLLAHSMGGLVARTMQLERPETWQRLMARDGARLLMLGTPNGGSWAPMQTLSGDDTFGNALVAFGSLFDNGGARRMMAGMPGFIQLQAALLDPAQGLDREATWAKLAHDDIQALLERSRWHDGEVQKSIYQWGAPPQAVLDQAVALRRRLDDQAGRLGADAQKMLLVVGHASFTPNGYTMSPDDGLEYLDVPDDGDGRVPLQSALLPGVKTWKVDAEHGKLPAVASAFNAYIELLETGRTDQLDAVVAPASRGREGAAAPAAAPVRSRPSHGAGTSRPPSSEWEVLGSAVDATAAARQRGAGAALQVSVYNGDVKFVREPLLIGHYRSTTLTGAERVVDGLVAAAMSRSLGAGLYPEPTGTQQVFGNQRCNPDNPLEMARPAAVIVVGLGEEGKLSGSALAYTTRQAVLAYAQRLTEAAGGAPTQFDLAATLMGSGGTGISTGAAAQSIVQGAIEANERLREAGWPLLAQLKLVELYLERAGDAWRALQQQQHATPQRLRLVGPITIGPGALRRSLDSSYRGTSYDFISVLAASDADGRRFLEWRLDTKRARTEVRAQQAQAKLLRNLVSQASNDANTDPLIGRTLFNLLVPLEVEPFLAGTTEMVIELDKGTAAIPWELLDSNPDVQLADRRPWALRSQLIRKLKTDQFRDRVVDSSPDDSVLVIGEPLCVEGYPRLEGARREAAAVAALLKAPGSGIEPEKVRALLDQPDAQSVTNALFERPYRAIHVSGHGAPGANGGVVLSVADTYLGANEVRAMRTVPELVFLNCCHLAGRDAATVLQPYDRADFAANIADELIRAGVRCVVAAGWAVEDDAAEQFALRLYGALLGGARFIEAVGAARVAAWTANPRGNTWAAYQCYGDPDWRWRRAGIDAQRPAPPLGDEYAGVASPVSLTLALEALIVRSRFGGAPAAGQLDKLRYLQAQFAPLWGTMGAVAEAFGLAYGAAGASDQEITWLQRAVDAEDGSASLRAAEQLGNAIVRRADQRDDLAGIADGIARLQRLVALRQTVERCSLLGSAYKRQTMALDRGGDHDQARAALAAMVKHYGEATTIARATGAANLFYPAKNLISAQVREALLAGRLPQLDAGLVKAVADSMQAAATAQPDFWSVVGQTELLVLQALAAGRLAGALGGIVASLGDLKGRVPAPKMWGSVHDEARFTLLPYIDHATGAEQAAARELIDRLAKMAQA